ncbi:MAG: phosphotransferase [Candidatus Magasanikbacteria bacterium]|nr:phosphotransferase [Candidatus Magasanikbacteria bacterium]
MFATRRDVNDYLTKKNFFPEFKIIGKRSGLSNCNYIIETPKGKYILRANKIKPSGSTNLLVDEYNVLKFFSELKLDFVPKTVFFDEEKNIHLLSYIEGRKIRFRNISQKGMEQAIAKLYQINLLADKFLDYCLKNNLTFKSPKSEVDRLRIRIEKKINDVNDDSIFSETKKWVIRRLEEDFPRQKIDQTRIFLNHGDPADNLILNKGNISIIDWEYSRLTYGPGLVHILAHGSMGKEKEEKLLQFYSKISGEPVAELRYQTYLEKNLHYLLKMAKICFRHQEGILPEYMDVENLKKTLERLTYNYNKIKKTIQE